MLTSDKESKREAFRAAIEQAQEDGLSTSEMAAMITAATEKQHPANGANPKDSEYVIYEPGELPEGLIDLPSASRKYGIPISTLQSWLRRGKLPRRGRVRARAAGGGYVVTEMAAIEYCRDNPRKRGPKSFARP